MGVKNCPDVDVVWIPLVEPACETPSQLLMLPRLLECSNIHRKAIIQMCYACQPMPSLSKLVLYLLLDTFIVPLLCLQHVCPNIACITTTSSYMHNITFFPSWVFRLPSCHVEERKLTLLTSLHPDTHDPRLCETLCSCVWRATMITLASTASSKITWCKVVTQQALARVST